MVSIIIPTLWIPKSTLEHTIEQFIKAKKVYPDIELILIDNKEDSTYSNSELNIVKPRKNIGVNPAWNIGSHLAINDHLLFMNDDVTVNFITLLKTVEKYDLSNKDYGIIGGQRELITQTDDFNSINDNNDDVQIIRNHFARYFGLGCFFMIKKINYHVIPSDFKIFYGDDLQFYIMEHICQKKCYFFRGLVLPGNMSVSTKALYDEPSKTVKDYNLVQTNNDEHQYWDKYREAILDYYKSLNAALFRGEKLEDMRCNCTECNCDEWHPASPQHCIGNNCECCEHEVEI